MDLLLGRNAATATACALVTATFALFASSAAGQGPPPGGGMPPGGGFGSGPCETTSGPATLSNVFAKGAGADDWRQFEGGCMVSYQEEPDPTGGTMRYLVVSFTSGGDQDLKPEYPKGTRISFDVSSAGAEPLFVLATGSQMAVQTPALGARGGASTMTIQGNVPTVNFAYQFGPNGLDCSGGTQQLDFYGVLIQFEPIGGPGTLANSMNAYKDFVIGTNAQGVGFNPAAITADGDIGVSIDGCGELDFEATLPIGGLALGGLTPPLADALATDLGSKGADKANLTELADNGQTVPGGEFDARFLDQGEIAPDPVPGTRTARRVRAAEDKVAAVGIDYETGSASHEMTTAPNEPAVKAAKKAVRKCKGGKLAVKKGKLVCRK